MADPGGLAASRVLVTGGAGFIGSNFVHHFLARFPQAHVVVLDALTYAGRRENLEGLPARSITFHHGDIRDSEAVRKAMAGCDLVLNFAAESHVDRSIEKPGEFILTDVYGVFVLCEEARRQSVRRFIQVSTDEVYGEVLEGSATEAWPLVPRSPYAASKAGGERLAFAYWATWGLPVVVTRCANNYGPRQYRRDWIHVEDHCAALVSLLEHPGIEGETFNIGAGHELDVLTITSTILELLGKPGTLIRHVEDRPGHDRRYALDCSKLRRVTGWQPKTGFADGIRRTVEWYRANEAWWRPIKQGEFRQYYERMYGQRKVLKEVRA